MSIKILREMMCAAQQGNDWPEDVRLAVHDLIDRIDLHRPLGLDGTHGDHHTETCGCEDKPPGTVLTRCVVCGGGGCDYCSQIGEWLA